MMHNGRILLICWAAAILSLPALGAELFPTPAGRQAFLKALSECDSRYDAKEQMLQAPFSSPGYHTTLTGGSAHSTRESFEYAVALLDSGEPERLKRAEAVLRRVIALQDQDPNSRTYGIWSWFVEEPLDKMSPPDWNWADFCGTQLLQVAIDHMSRLPADLQQKVRDSILHAARSIQRRDVQPGYTNIALMGTYVTLVAGERFNNTELVDYGRTRLRRFWEYTFQKGSFSEYNSPTYTCVAIEEISRMMQHVRDEDSQNLLEKLNEFAWQHLARRFHPPTRQWAGPHSRCYPTLLRPSALAATSKDGWSRSSPWRACRPSRTTLSKGPRVTLASARAPATVRAVVRQVSTRPSASSTTGTARRTARVRPLGALSSCFTRSPTWSSTPACRRRAAVPLWWLATVFSVPSASMRNWRRGKSRKVRTPMSARAARTPAWLRTR